jgi:hypothetical protein
VRTRGEIHQRQEGAETAFLYTCSACGKLGLKNGFTERVHVYNVPNFKKEHTFTTLIVARRNSCSRCFRAEDKRQQQQQRFHG